MSSDRVKPIKKLTVSDLALCQRCPRLLAYQNRGKKNLWKVGIEAEGTKNSCGSIFHTHIAGAFFADAANSDRAMQKELVKMFSGVTKKEDLLSRFESFIKTYYFDPFLERENKKSRKLSIERILALAKAAELWINGMVDFLYGIPSLLSKPDKTLQHVFIKPEQDMKASFTYDDGLSLEIAGRYDAILFDDDKKQAVLFEFKTYMATNPLVALSQSLSYAWLIKNTTGIVPAIYIFHLGEPKPDKMTLRLTPSEVSSMMDNMLHLLEEVRNVMELKLPLKSASDPSLCGICPMRKNCESDWGAFETSQALRAKPEPSHEEAQVHMERLLKTLADLKIYVTDEGYICGPCFIRLKVLPDASKGTTVDKIERSAKDLQVQMSLATRPLIQAQSGYVGVDVPRSIRQVLTLDDLLEAGRRNRPNSDSAFPLGMTVDGRVFWADLAEPTMTSVLIGGTSGSGKSVLLRSVVQGLLRCSPRDGISFTLIDPKRVTFIDFKDMPFLEEGTVLYDADSAMDALQKAVEEMELRYDSMERAGVSNITDYNRSSEEQLKRRIIIIDEYADLMTDKQTCAQLELFIQRICQKGRAAGLHLFLSTQRPDAKIVTGVIKANLQLRIALKVASQSNSQIILGDGVGQAHCLLGHGDMLVGNGSSVERLQGAIS